MPVEHTGPGIPSLPCSSPYEPVKLAGIEGFVSNHSDSDPRSGIAMRTRAGRVCFNHKYKGGLGAGRRPAEHKLVQAV